MSREHPLKPGLHCLVIRHAAWCPLSYGEGATCAPGCSPVAEFMGATAFGKLVSRDLRNRAQRRAAAKRKAGR